MIIERQNFLKYVSQVQSSRVAAIEGKLGIYIYITLFITTEESAFLVSVYLHWKLDTSKKFIFRSYTKLFAEWLGFERNLLCGLDLRLAC